jgi:hypothetical protein
MSDACRYVRAVWWGAQGVLCALALPAGAVDISQAREVAPPPGDRGELLHEVPITSAPVPKLAPLGVSKPRDPLPAASTTVRPVAPGAVAAQPPTQTVKTAPSVRAKQAGPTPRTEPPAIAKKDVRARELRASKVAVAQRPGASKRASASTLASERVIANTAATKRAKPSAKALVRAAPKAADRSQAVTRRKAAAQAASSPASKAGRKASSKVPVKASAKPSATASRKVSPTVRKDSGKTAASSARRSAVQKGAPTSTQVVKSKQAAQRR